MAQKRYQWPPKIDGIEFKESKVKPAQWLEEYEENLTFWLHMMKSYGECDPQTADVVLHDRSDLQASLRRHPDGLTKEQRKKLRELDKHLKEAAPLMLKCLPVLPQERRRLRVPRSHWWWFLDRLVAHKDAKRKLARSVSKR